MNATPKRGRDPWATRLAIISTLLLLFAIIVAPVRAFLAFLAISLMLIGFVLEFRARRAGAE